MQPLKHQIEAIEALKNSRGFLLADDMGLGKTASALFAARDLNCSVTVICPAFLTENWKREAENIGVSIEVYSYNKAPKELKEVPKILIVDESHYIKTVKAQRTKFVVGLAELVRERGGKVWLLSGTPMTRDVDDYYSQLFAIDAIPANKKTGKPWSFSSWKDAVMEQVPDRWATCGFKYAGFNKKGKELLDSMKTGKFLRRHKDEVLDLPTKIRTSLVIATCAKSLRAELVKLEQALETGDNITTHFMSAKRELAELKARKVGKAIAEEQKECAGFESRSIVIFSAHKQAAAECAAEIAKAGVTVAIITGDTAMQERARIVQDFQTGKISVLVATIGAAGVGLTLTRASDVRFIDKSFSPAENLQAEDRCYRIGQTQRVVITDYLTNDPVEARINQLLLDKQELIAKSLKEEARKHTEDKLKADADYDASLMPADDYIDFYTYR